MRVIVDMNPSPRRPCVLIEAGLEAVHWSNIGRSDAPNVDIIAHAAEQDFVILTHDLDFGAILAITGGDRPSVVQIRADDLDPDVLGTQVIVAIRRMEDPLRAGALLTIDISRGRIRMLPLRTAPEA